MYDAIVIGGGVVGLSAAYHLVRDGAKTLVIDRADVGRATDAGAGILAPETASRDSDAWVQFAIPAVQLYPTLVAQLEADGADDTGYAVCGQLTVAASEDEDEAFATARQRVFARQQRRGTPSAANLHAVSASEAQTLFPALGEMRGAFYYRNGARVDGRLLAAALRHGATSRGLTIRTASVEQLVLRDNSVTGVVVDNEEISGGAVAIAGGAWSATFAAQLGVTIPIAPQRGQIIHLTLPDTETGSWPVVNAFHGHYMVAWPDQRVVVGATREIEAGFDPRATAAGVHEVLGEALRVAPGLAAATLREVRIGLRPGTPDNLPVLGEVPGLRSVYLTAGHGATGLQLGPYSGKVIADLIGGNAIETDISALSVTRFAS